MNKKQNLYYYALLMLIRNPARLAVMIAAILFSTLIIIQQPAVYNGICARLVGLISDIKHIDLWVMDKGSISIEHFHPIPMKTLYQVSSVPGVQWAEPLHKFLMLGLHHPSGEKAVWYVIGVDNERMVGAPESMVKGDIQELTEGGNAIVDNSAVNYFKKSDVAPGKRRIIEIGDHLEFPHMALTVTGVSKNTPPFLMYPLMFTDYDSASTILGDESPNFILVKVKPNANIENVIHEIDKIDGIRAYTVEQFKKRSLHFFLFRTAMFFNFALVVLLGYVIGFVIVGITFFNFVSDHLYQFGTLKILGAKNQTIIYMVFMQALLIGLVGYLLGLLTTLLFNYLLSYTQLTSILTTNLLIVSFCAMIFISLAAAYFSVRQILKFEVTKVFEA